MYNRLFLSIHFVILCSARAPNDIKLQLSEVGGNVQLLAEVSPSGVLLVERYKPDLVSSEVKNNNETGRGEVCI